MLVAACMHTCTGNMIAYLLAEIRSPLKLAASIWDFVNYLPYLLSASAAGCCCAAATLASQENISSSKKTRSRAAEKSRKRPFLLQQHEQQRAVDLDLQCDDDEI